MVRTNKHNRWLGNDEQELELTGPFKWLSLLEIDHNGSSGFKRTDENVQRSPSSLWQALSPSVGPWFP